MDTIKELLSGRYGIERTPRYIADRCTARKTNGNACTACADICPQQIYPYGKRKRPVWDQCLKCGLCASACPARCITPPADRINAYLLSVVKRRPLTIGCDREEHACRISVRCAAAVSWEQLACAALREGVALCLYSCAQCDGGQGFRLIQDNLNRLRFFLGEERYAQKVAVWTDKSEPVHETEETISRRELFHFIGDLALDKAYAALPDMEDSRSSGLFCRAILRDAADAESGGKFGMFLPKFNERCYDCGYCIRACPNGALQTLDADDSFCIAVEPWKCTGCGICWKICRAGGITGIFPAQVPHLRQIALGRFPRHLCVRCGTPIPRTGDELCSACLSRERRGNRICAEPNSEGQQDAATR
jgi:NAD-dependent dihydropyrimidine dehydrogenase PreA subunit